MIPLFLLPILTRKLSTEEYGIISLFNTFISLASPFVGLELYRAYVRACFNKEMFCPPTYAGTIIIVISINSVALLSATLLMRYVFFNAISYFLILSVYITTLSASLMHISTSNFQVNNDLCRYGFLVNGQSFTDMTFAILLVAFLNMGWQGRLVSKIISSCTFAVIGICILIKTKRVLFRFDKLYLRHSLFYSLPLVPHAFASVINSSIDRLFISKMLGIDQVGLYAIGYQFGAVIYIIASSFNKAYLPWLFNALNKRNVASDRKIVKFTYLYMIFILLASISLSIITPYVMHYFLGEAFRCSSIYVFWVSLGYSFHGMYYAMSNFIFYSEKTKFILFSTITGAVLNIVLNYFLINKNGAIGAAQATALTYFLVFFFAWIVSAHVYPMPWNLLKRVNGNDERNKK